MPEKIIKWGIALLASFLVPCIILMKGDIVIPLYIALTKNIQSQHFRSEGIKKYIRHRRHPADIIKILWKFYKPKYRALTSFLTIGFIVSRSGNSSCTYSFSRNKLIIRMDIIGAQTAQLEILPFFFLEIIRRI